MILRHDPRRRCASGAATPTMTEITLTLVLVLCGIVGAVLAWGMRSAGAPAPPHGESGRHPGRHEPQQAPLPAIYLRHRTMLMRSWDADLPDLQVIAWESEDSSPSVVYYSAQFFMQLPEDRDLILAAVERAILSRALALDDTFRPLERLRGAWHFFHLPAMEQTLIIESGADATGCLRHKTMLLSAGGALEELPSRSASSLLRAFTAVHLAYRNALGSWLEKQEPESARRQFRSVLEADPTMGGAHAWLAMVALRGEDDPVQARRHLAFAEELAPALPGTRLAAAELRPRRDAERNALPMLFEGETLSADGMCLLAQSFLALDQPAVARHLCSEVLGREPGHRDARALLEEIGEREWRMEA